MSDGGNLGVSATTALNAILGGEQPAEDDLKTRDEVRDRIKAQFADPDSVYPAGEWVNTSDGGDSYSRGADYLAGAVLAYFEAHPEAQEWPVDQEHERERDWRIEVRRFVNLRARTEQEALDLIAEDPGKYLSVEEE